MVSKPTVSVNWITFAVALYLRKSYETALDVLVSFEKTLKDNKDTLKPNQRSEITLFKARVYQDMGDH